MYLLLTHSFGSGVKRKKTENSHELPLEHKKRLGKSEKLLLQRWPTY